MIIIIIENEVINVIVTWHCVCLLREHKLCEILSVVKNKCFIAEYFHTC